MSETFRQFIARQLDTFLRRRCSMRRRTIRTNASSRTVCGRDGNWASSFDQLSDSGKGASAGSSLPIGGADLSPYTALAATVLVQHRKATPPPAGEAIARAPGVERAATLDAATASARQPGDPRVRIGFVVSAESARFETGIFRCRSPTSNGGAIWRWRRRPPTTANHPQTVVEFAQQFALTFGQRRSAVEQSLSSRRRDRSRPERASAASRDSSQTACAS
jgi:hypothetical protein